MKKKFIVILSIMLVIMLFASCSLGGTYEPEYETDNSSVIPVSPEEGNYDPETGITLLPEGNGIRFEEEADGATPDFKKEDASKFIGEWEATSDQAIHLYGNIDLTVNKDHTWTANITDERYEGSWDESKTGLRMESDRFSFELAFDENGTLIMTEYGQSGGSDIHTVLTRKTSDE